MRLFFTAKMHSLNARFLEAVGNLTLSLLVSTASPENRS